MGHMGVGMSILRSSAEGLSVTGGSLKGPGSPILPAELTQSSLEQQAAAGNWLSSAPSASSPKPAGSFMARFSMGHNLICVWPALALISRSYTSSLTNSQENPVIKFQVITQGKGPLCGRQRQFHTN